jgi:exopolysaccharide biosynthesis operon protein EpsL
MVRLACLARWATALLALGSAGATLAQDTDGLDLSASYTLRHDDNLFRLPDGVRPQAVLGRPSAGETMDISSLGLRYAKTHSLQRIELDVSLVDYRYRTHQRLDLLATNYDLAWRWALTPRLRGSLRAEQDESVNSFDDASVLTSGNQRTQRHEAFDAVYEIDGAWRLVAGVLRTRNQNEQPLLGEESYVLRSAEAGLRYDASSGSSVTWRLRKGSGSTLAGLGPPVLLRDTEFDQDEQVLDVRWLASAKTTVELNLVHLPRRHDRLALRDYDGTNAALSLRWSATAKTLWTLQWSSDVSSYQSLNASHVRTDKLQLGHVWQIAARTTLQASLGETRRRFLGPPPGRTPDPTREATQEASLGLRWAVSRNLSLNTSLQHTQRRGNRPGLAFSSTQALVGLSLRTSQ